MAQAQSSISPQLLQLLQMLQASSSMGGAGRPLPNAAPTFGSGNGGSMGGMGATPANFGQGAIMPQPGGGGNQNSMLPLLMAMQKNNQSGGSSGGKGGGLFGGKGGGAGGSDLTAEMTAPGNQDALMAAFGSGAAAGL